MRGIETGRGLEGEGNGCKEEGKATDAEENARQDRREAQADGEGGGARIGAGGRS